MRRLKPLARRTLFLANIALLTIPLASCGTVHFKISCPALASYSKEFQAAAAVELYAAGSHVKTLVTDYGKHRDACRAMAK